MSTKELKKTGKPVIDGIRRKKKKEKQVQNIQKKKLILSENMSSLAG